MNRQVRDSLDGRYFGPLPATAIIGRAIPLWTDEAGDGRFVWRAPTRDGVPIPNLTAIPRRFSMPQIGQFTRDEVGFIGASGTLLLHQDIVLVPAESSDAENAPDYRVHSSTA